MLLSGSRAVQPCLTLTQGSVQAAGAASIHCLAPSESIFGAIVLYPTILHFPCLDRISASSSFLQLLQNISKLLGCDSVILDYIFGYQNLFLSIQTYQSQNLQLLNRCRYAEASMGRTSLCESVLAVSPGAVLQKKSFHSTDSYSEPSCFFMLRVSEISSKPSKPPGLS